MRTTIHAPVRYFESAILSRVDKSLDWERVRIAGRLPLFAASYSALIAIPPFFYGLEIYNDKVQVLRRWAEQAVRGSGTMGDHTVAQTVRERLYPLAVPALSVLLLISTVFLAIGATIDALAYPPRVKEFSRDQWTYQLGHSVVHYLADAWRQRWLRVAASACYIVGGAGAGYVLSAS